jgi:hypothetical protein
MPESLYGAHPKKLPVRFKLPSHLDLLRFQHAKVKVGSPDHFSRHAKQNGNEMKQVMNHNKDNGLLNMIRRTDTMISECQALCEHYLTVTPGRGGVSSVLANS